MYPLTYLNNILNFVEKNPDINEEDFSNFINKEKNICNNNEKIKLLQYIRGEQKRYYILCFFSVIMGGVLTFYLFK